MKQTIEAPNGAGWIRIEGSAKSFSLETSFAPFGSHRFVEELEKRMHVLEVKRSRSNTGIYRVRIETGNYPLTEGLTITELVTEAAEESKIFDA